MQLINHNKEISFEISKNYLHKIANCILHPIRSYREHRSEVAKAVADLNQVRELAEASIRFRAKRGEGLRKIANVEDSIDYMSNAFERSNRQDINQLDVEVARRDKIYYQQGEMNEPEQESKGDVVHEAAAVIAETETVELRQSYIDTVANRIAKRTSAFQAANALSRDLVKVKTSLENSAPDSLNRLEDLAERVRAYNQIHSDYQIPF
ncbi:MAG: hypothetical protein SP4CHLAM5_07790 [Chlamydiia bacterium]|nr:hypothetical protein [Chlamydiia bacterium]MCH9618643.1 hypothetical protein [Chlamydiia bacterium]MCH9623834.1 hypothetical protein [Chlamydiia bacterium]